MVANRQKLDMLNLNGTAIPGMELLTTGAMAMDISLVDQKICWVQVGLFLTKCTIMVLFLQEEKGKTVMVTLTLSVSLFVWLAHDFSCPLC